LKLRKRLRDDRYLVAEVELEGKRLVYLADFKEGTESLGVVRGNLDVEALWNRCKEEPNLCFPCELLLNLDPKVVSAGNSVAELGIPLETLSRVRKFLMEGADEGG